MLALLKDFDLAWPRVTTTAMSWSETANLGIAVTAPQCYWPGFGFYHNWALTMTFPVRPLPPPPFPLHHPRTPTCWQQSPRRTLLPGRIRSGMPLVRSISLKEGSSRMCSVHNATRHLH